MSQTLPERRRASAPQRYEPLSEFEQVTERMRRMLEQTLGGFAWTAPLLEKGGWSPLVDLEETDDAYVVEADLPGVSKQDVTVELVGNELLITGEATVKKERKGTVRRRTRHTGRFDYRVSLPTPVDPAKIEASLADGVLTVKIPKSEKAQRRKIQIKESEAEGPGPPGPSHRRRRRLRAEGQ